MTTIQLVALIVAGLFIIGQLGAIAWLLDRCAGLRRDLAEAERARDRWRGLTGARPPEDRKP